MEAEGSRGKQKEADRSRGEQREAEGSGGKQREAEGSQGKPREAEGSRGKQKEAEGSSRSASLYFPLRRIGISNGSFVAYVYKYRSESSKNIHI